MLEPIDDLSKKSSDNAVKEETSDKYKYNTVELPSNGKLGYPKEIQYRDILVKDEKELASTTEKTFQPVLNRILSGLLKDSSFYKRMTIHDRDFLILWVWANNYSTTKNIEYSCPHCEHENTEDVDLTQIPVHTLDEKFINPLPHTLKSGEEVTFRLLTTKDEETARNFCSSNKNYEESFVMMCMSITFKTVMQLREKITYIEENLTGKDMSVLRGFHKHFKYGIDDVVDLECKNCGEVSKIAIPFQVDFFIPSISDDFE